MITYRTHHHEADWHQIREEVFIKEQGFHNEFDDIDKKAIHLVLYQDDQAIGCGRIYQEEKDPDVWHLGRLAVYKAYRKGGYGKQIVTYLEQMAKAHGAKKIVLSAQLQALPFYERLSYIAYGEPYLDEHVMHQDMSKLL